MGTSLTAGQKYFFEQRLTWHPHTKQPSLGLWGEGEMEDPKIDEYNVKGKNVSAVHQLYSNIHRGITLTSKTILKRKSAIYVFLQTLPSQTLAHLLDFDDEESKYSGFRGINSKQHFENLAIIFSGSYNGGESCLSETCTPYIMTENNGDYSATKKLNWENFFPIVVMLL